MLIIICLACISAKQLNVYMIINKEFIQFNIKTSHDLNVYQNISRDRQSHNTYVAIAKENSNKT